MGGRSYGPYTLEQMKAFQAEGRLAPHSLVARKAKNNSIMPARMRELALLFPAGAPADRRRAAANSPSEPSPGPHGFGRDSQPAGERSRYIIIVGHEVGLDQRAGRGDLQFRPVHSAFMPQAWILTSEVSLNTLRSELIQKLGKLDTLIVVDTTHDKAAWFNFGPEADTKMRRLWQREAAAIETCRLIPGGPLSPPKAIRKSLMLRPRIYPQPPAKNVRLNASVVIRLGVGVQHRTVDLSSWVILPADQGPVGRSLPASHAFPAANSSSHGAGMAKRSQRSKSRDNLSANQNVHPLFRQSSLEPA